MIKITIYLKTSSAVYKSYLCKLFLFMTHLHTYLCIRYLPTYLQGIERFFREIVIKQFHRQYRTRFLVCFEYHIKMLNIKHARKILKIVSCVSIEWIYTEENVCAILCNSLPLYSVLHFESWLNHSADRTMHNFTTPNYLSAPN